MTVTKQPTPWRKRPSVYIRFLAAALLPYHKFLPGGKPKMPLELAGAQQKQRYSGREAAERKDRPMSRSPSAKTLPINIESSSLS